MNCDLCYYPVLQSEQLIKNKLSRVFLFDLPVVVYRGDGGAINAYEDYCPHRGAMLSEGRIVNNELECAYHGWRFNNVGLNTFVPVKNEAVTCSLKRVFVVEKYGMIWLASNEHALIPKLNSAQPNLVFNGNIDARLENALENFLEGSHTHFVHDGLVRSSKMKRQKINATMIPSETGFKVFYQPEAAKGWLTKLLPRKIQNLKPVSEYIYPSIAILEYFNSKDESIARIETILTQNEDRISYQARVFLNVGMLSKPAAFLSKFIFRKVVEQDKLILEQQQKNLKYFQEKTFFSDDTDIVGKELYAWIHGHDPAEKNLNFFVYW